MSPAPNSLTGMQHARVTLDMPVTSTGNEKLPDDPVARHLTLNLRVLLNQGNGTWLETNAIANDLAAHILRHFNLTEKETE